MKKQSSFHSAVKPFKHLKNESHVREQVSLVDNLRGSKGSRKLATISKSCILFYYFLFMFIYNFCAFIVRIPSGNLKTAFFSKDAVFRGPETILKSCCENPTFSNLHATKKIVIIGSPGAGKTTLAKELGPILNIKVYHLDRILWHRSWKEKDRETRIDILEHLIRRENRWIIEGTYIHVSELHLKAADTIIFLDISSLLCSQRLIKRHCEYYRRSRRDIPLGSTDRLTQIRIFKVLTFPFHGLRTIKQTLRSYNPEQIISLHSPKEVEDFLAQLECFLAQQRELLSVGS